MVLSVYWNSGLPGPPAHGRPSPSGNSAATAPAGERRLWDPRRCSPTGELPRDCPELRVATLVWYLQSLVHCPSNEGGREAKIRPCDGGRDGAWTCSACFLSRTRCLSPGCPCHSTVVPMPPARMHHQPGTVTLEPCPCQILLRKEHGAKEDCERLPLRLLHAAQAQQRRRSRRGARGPRDEHAPAVEHPHTHSDLRQTKQPSC